MMQLRDSPYVCAVKVYVLLEQGAGGEEEAEGEKKTDVEERAGEGWNAATDAGKEMLRHEARRAQQQQQAQQAQQQQQL